jgi:hypothetical protein
LFFKTEENHLIKNREMENAMSYEDLAGVGASGGGASSGVPQSSDVLGEQAANQNSDAVMEQQELPFYLMRAPPRMSKA